MNIRGAACGQGIKGGGEHAYFSNTYLHIPKSLESWYVGCEQCAHLGGVVDGLVDKVGAPEHTRAVDTILVHVHGVLDILRIGDK